MTDPFDISTIPDDPAYWDALAARVAYAAVRRPVASEWLARGRTPWVVAASLACAASLMLALLPRPQSPSRPVASNAAWLAALSPRDAIGRSLASSGSAPPLVELLAVTAAEAQR